MCWNVLCLLNNIGGRKQGPPHIKFWRGSSDGHCPLLSPQVSAPAHGLANVIPFKRAKCLANLAKTSGTQTYICSGSYMFEVTDKISAFKRKYPSKRRSSRPTWPMTCAVILFYLASVSSEAMRNDHSARRVRTMMQSALSTGLGLYCPRPPHLVTSYTQP